MLLSDVKYKKRILLRCIHHFKSDLSKNMDHMHISGTEPSSVILIQKKYFQKSKNSVQYSERNSEKNKFTLEVADFRFLRLMIIYSLYMSYFSVTVNRYGTVLRADNSATNGVVHVIDTVLFPQNWRI